MMPKSSSVSPLRLSSRRRSGASLPFVLFAAVALCCAAGLGRCSASSGDPSLKTDNATLEDALTFSSLPSPSPFSPDGKNFPNPTSDPAACNRPPGRPSWLCDPDGILSEGAADEIEGVLRDVALAKKPFAKSSCASSSGSGQRAGFQVALATLARLDLSATSSSAADATEEFASSLMDLWGVGHAGCDDGVVVVLSKEDRQVS